MRILQGLRPRYEQHHQVTYTDVALEGATRLARRHLRDLRLPDSAIAVIDEAGASLRLNPPEDGRRIADEPEVERVVSRMARIPESQASRLRELGAWLRVNGEAIFDPAPTTSPATTRSSAGTCGTRAARTGSTPMPSSSLPPPPSRSS